MLRGVLAAEGDIETWVSTLSESCCDMFKSKELNNIYELELAAGNQVVEDTQWFPTCVKLVILKNRFQRPYTDQKLKYRELNDSHYWFSEYEAEDKKEVLACRF